MSIYKNCAVIYNGKVMSYINWRLAERRGITQQGMDQIIELHVEKLRVLDEMKNTDDARKLRLLADDITQLEFALQYVWGFPEDRNFHRWWEVPKCTCPKMDNEDRYGTGYEVVNCDCPIHGGCDEDFYEYENNDRVDIADHSCPVCGK